MTTIADRVYDCVPVGNYAFTALLRLLDVVETDAVETAAVECVAAPRLLVNAAFVDRHAATPEKLLMLVMHELHHVLLGHTRLFPRVTPVDNFVFDTVINSVISRMFPTEEHLALLTDFYADDAFPSCLLRPPSGWRGGPLCALPPGIERLPHTARAAAGDVYRALYSPTGAGYEEVYRVLPAIVVEADLHRIVLLGGHAEDGVDEAASRSALLVEAIAPIVGQWSQPPNPIRGRSMADLLRETTHPSRSRPSNRAVLRRLIRHVAGHSGHGRLSRVADVSGPAVSAIPSLDRRRLVAQALGHEPLLHSSVVSWRRRIRTGERVHVYLDVSGSMDDFIAAVYGAVVDCEALVHHRVHLFSTTVSDVDLVQLRRGVRRTTNGTDVSCIADHMRRHAIRRAVVITDGYVGQPAGGDHDTLAAARLGVCYVGEPWTADLQRVADVTATLTSEVRA